MREAFENPSSTQNLHRATRCSDPLAGLLAEGVQPNGEAVPQRPVRQTLDRKGALHQSTTTEIVGSHRAAGREACQCAQADDRVPPSGKRPEAALRQSPLERHLPTFVSGRTVATG